MKNETKKDKSKKRFSPVAVILIMICVGVFAFSAYKLVPMLLEYAQGDKEYSELTDVAEFPLPEDIPSAPSDNADASETLAMLNRNFSALSEINPDVVGWITLPNTVINYPVVKGEDNQKYLHTTFDGTYNKNGCIFLDKSNSADFSDANSLIYGHHMKSGSMFARLCDYKEQDFYDKNPVLYLYMPEHIYELQVFSAYVSEKTADYYSKDFENDAQKLAYFEELRGRSQISSNVELGENDRIITLQTCTYEFYDARFIVHAKIVAIS